MFSFLSRRFFYIFFDLIYKAFTTRFIEVCFGFARQPEMTVYLLPN